MHGNLHKEKVKERGRKYKIKSVSSTYINK